MTSTATKSDASATGAVTAWSPFRYTAFTVLWMATVVSFVGTWMNDVGAGWVMAKVLDGSPVEVALVQTAITLPAFLFALPAGAIADIIDRRIMLLIISVSMAVVTGLLGFLVLSGVMTPVLLLFFVLLTGLGTAFTAPTWQAIVPSLIPRDHLQPAVALNGVGINISRAIGPTLAGILIAQIGVSVPFFVNMLSFLVVAAAVLWWRPDITRTTRLPSEHLSNAMRAGLRYARSSRHLKATLCRAVLFFIFISAYWALLPLVAKDLLAGGAELYGYLLGAVGAGAVTGAVFLPRVRDALGPDNVVAAGSLGSAVAIFLFALVPNPYVAVGAAFLAGVSWIAAMAVFNVSAQIALPEWVRGRGLSVFLMMLFGSLSLGSFIWGQVAQLIDIKTSLLIAGIGAALGVLISYRWKLQGAAGLDLSPSGHWATPIVAEEVEEDRGPVMITTEYNINRKDRDEFLKAVRTLGFARRRSGAYDWGIFESASRPGCYIEYFMVDSWIEHLRQHERVTEADRIVQEKVQKFQKNGKKPKVNHYIAPKQPL